MFCIPVLVCFFVTAKYHIRFNEERRFHEMSDVNFDLALSAKKIDSKLLGLNWITPIFKKNPIDEINLINEVLAALRKDDRTKMVLTNYSFLSSILNENLNSPSRWYIPTGPVYPIENNKYFYAYKAFLLNSIKKNNIDVIYVIEPIENEELYRYIDKSCFDENTITPILKRFNFKRCDEINKST